jgi:hypothetical protein
MHGDLRTGRTWRRNMSKRERMVGENWRGLRKSYLIASLTLFGCRIENTEKGQRY